MGIIIFWSRQLDLVQLLFEAFYKLFYRPSHFKCHTLYKHHFSGIWCWLFTVITQIRLSQFSRIKNPLCTKSSSPKISLGFRIRERSFLFKYFRIQYECKNYFKTLHKHFFSNCPFLRTAQSVFSHVNTREVCSNRN